MEFEFVEQPERWVAGRATRTRNIDEMDPGRARLPALWQRASRDGEMVAVLTDYESDRNGEYTEVVGWSIDDPEQLAPGHLAVRIPAGTYVRVRAEGELPRAIVEAWTRIWAAEEAGRLRRSYQTDFEIWRPSNTPEIYLSVQS